MKRQKSVPEDLKRSEEDGGSLTELDLHRPFEEEVGSIPSFGFSVRFTEMSCPFLQNDITVVGTIEINGINH